jgi:3-phosphoshikimate 1-carboxyvinyltransferase
LGGALGYFQRGVFYRGALLLAPGSELMLRNVNTNPTRDGVLEVLEKMGATIQRERSLVAGGRTHYRSSHSSPGIEGRDLWGGDHAALVDEVPILALAATQADGTTEIRGAGELRVKESDRLAHIAKGLEQNGGPGGGTSDGLRITGPTPLKGAVLDSAGDHRLAMTFAVAGFIARGETEIDNADCVDISFPTFWQDLERLRVQS